METLPVPFTSLMTFECKRGFLLSIFYVLLEGKLFVQDDAENFGSWIVFNYVLFYKANQLILPDALTMG